jgi:hypothetical protein
VSLPWQADLVIRAARELSDIEKLVWCEDRGLDQGPAGCFAGASVIAGRLGRSRDTVERARRGLVHVELHETQARARGSTASWYARLPVGAVPVVPPGETLETWRPDPALVRRLADRLDQHLRAIRGPRREESGGSLAATPEPEVAAAPPPVAGRVAATAPPSGGNGAAGGGGSPAARVAAPGPPRSSSSSRKSSLSSSGECEAVAYATTAEAESENGSLRRLRCDGCGRPLAMTSGGRLQLCSCGSREADPDVVARAAMAEGA